MHYAILANPYAGRMTVDQKRASLSAAAALLNAPVRGLDLTTRSEFVRCARELSDRCDVLVVAGGDGTVSDVVNAIDTRIRPIAYIPLGTGNALQYALENEGHVMRAARQIKTGTIHTFDLIECNSRIRAFMVSIGLESHILHCLARSRRHTRLSFWRYARIALKAYFNTYRPPAAGIVLDDRRLAEKTLLSLMVMKQPYYGFGLKVMPEAHFDDGLLHVRCISARLPQALWGAVTALTIGNRAGKHRAGRSLAIQLDRPLFVQIDGNLGWRSDHFRLRVLPGALKIKF